MLEGINDYLSTLPQTLQWVSRTLNNLTGIPWPLWLGGLFPIYLVALSITIWTLRGTSWPVRCAYPITKAKIPCRIFVPGEWYRCRHHNSVRYHRSVSGGHFVDTKIPRWKQVDRRGKLVDAPAIGIGFIRTRPVGHTLLYEFGYTRTPGNVASILPEFSKKLWRRVRAVRLRGSGDDEAEDRGDPNSIVEAQDPMVSELDSVVTATRFALGIFIAALLTTGISMLFTGSPQAMIQWVATLAFVLAWAAVNSGIRLREWDWLSRSCRKSLVWWLKIFLPVALLNVVFMMVN